MFHNIFYLLNDYIIYQDIFSKHFLRFIFLTTSDLFGHPESGMNRLYLMNYLICTSIHIDIEKIKYELLEIILFLTFPACFYTPIFFSNLNSNPNLLGMRNLQEQFKKAFCYQNLFWNCSHDLKNFANSRPSAY